MSILPAESETGTDGEPPGNYQALDHHEPRWEHAETGLRVGLVRDGRPSARRMTRETATAPDDDTWIFEVRPNEHAEIYRRLDGDRAAALAYAREWMADHADGVLGD
jgi:hypothetical protein